MPIRIFVAALALASVFASSIQGEVVTYPTPPGLTTSPDFTVTASGANIWVEKNGGDGTAWVHGDLAMMNAASFACAGPVTIKVTASANITSYIIRPKSRKITGSVSGRDLTFTLPGPQYLYLEINNLPHLAIFADPLEVNPPKQGDPNVVYYAPGSHSGDINLQSNRTYYVSPGAYIQGNVNGSGLQNVKILGRGIIDGRISISNSSNLEINGIMIQHSPRGWTNTLTSCSNMSYRHVKVWSWPENSVDGINPVSCKNFTIDNCFIRACDDCIAVKSMSQSDSTVGITVTNNVMVGWAFSDGITLGYELNGTVVRDVLVKNCDILYARSFGKHSGFSIMCDGPAWVKNIRFEDIRCEEKVENKNFEITVTNGTEWGSEPPGHVQGVYLKNITWENTSAPIILGGFSSANLVDSVTFDNCYVGNKLLTSTSDANFQINSHVRNVKFVATNPKTLLQQMPSYPELRFRQTSDALQVSLPER